MDNTLLKNLKPITLAGAVLYHNQDCTYAKAFVGEGDAMVCRGFSTEEKWRPCALELAIKWLSQNGVEVPREQNPYAPAEPNSDAKPKPKQRDELLKKLNKPKAPK